MLTQEQVDEFEQRLTVAIDAHLASGGKLLTGRFVNVLDIQALCPIACLTGAFPPKYYFEAVAEKMGFDYSLEDQLEFIKGFDNSGKFSVVKTPLYKLGQKLRDKYLPISYEDQAKGEFMSSEFKQYRRKQIAELRPYVEGEVLTARVSISMADLEKGSPKLGDMIARNPLNHQDQWLVAAQYFADNFEPVA